MIVMNKMIGIPTLAEILKPINKIPADKIGMKAKTAKSPALIIFTFRRLYLLLLIFCRSFYRALVQTF